MSTTLPRTMLAVMGMGIVCAVGGCAGASNELKQTPQQLLAGTAWQLVELGNDGVLAPARPTLEFTAPGMVSGSGSCNRFSGSVTLSGEGISFGPLAATRMACAEQVDAQEARYFKALEGAQRFVVEGDTLAIHSKVMDQPMVFIRTPPK